MEMNAALAKAILALLPTAAAVPRDAGGDVEITTGDNDLEIPFEMGYTDFTAAYGLKVLGDDNPTWAKAMKSDEAN
eukprot:5471099-Pleurochrysis_carterae.AAC.1